MAIRNLNTIRPDTDDLTCEASFRRFESDMRAVALTYPQPITFRPTGLSPASYVSRFRMSMGAFINSNWISDVDRGIILKVRQEFVFTRDDTLGLVYIGPRARQNFGPPSEKQELNINSVINAEELEVVHAICLLKNRNILNGEIALVNITEALALALMEQYPNTAIQHNPDNTGILI